MPLPAWVKVYLLCLVVKRPAWVKYGQAGYIITLSICARVDQSGTVAQDRVYHHNVYFAGDKSSLRVRPHPSHTGLLIGWLGGGDPSESLSPPQKTDFQGVVFILYAISRLPWGY